MLFVGKSELFDIIFFTNIFDNNVGKMEKLIYFVAKNSPMSYFGSPG